MLLPFLLLLAACSPGVPSIDPSQHEVVVETKFAMVYTLCNHGHRVYLYKAYYAGGIAVVPGACARGE